MLTVANVSEHLMAFGAATATFGTSEVKAMIKVPMAKGYSMFNETYGKQSMLYVSAPDMVTRRRLEQFLKSKGAVVNRGYSPGSPTLEVQVRYFKGYHWDE